MSRPLLPASALSQSPNPVILAGQCRGFPGPCLQNISAPCSSLPSHDICNISNQCFDFQKLLPIFWMKAIYSENTGVNCFPLFEPFLFEPFLFHLDESFCSSLCPCSFPDDFHQIPVYPFLFLNYMSTEKKKNCTT